MYFYYFNNISRLFCQKYINMPSGASGHVRHAKGVVVIPILSCTAVPTADGAVCAHVRLHAITETCVNIATWTTPLLLNFLVRYAPK